ncbi:MAG: hypothetical protein AAFY48_07890 [Bacteroidota bacterium]
MQIHPNDSIQQVQDRFQAIFPLLQLRFYRLGHQLRASSDQRDEIIDSKRQLSSINAHFEACEIRVDAQTKAGELEMEFARLLGLYVQVVRKAGKEWIQTTNTDEWTLQRQQEVAAQTEEFYQNIRR